MTAFEIAEFVERLFHVLRHPTFQLTRFIQLPDDERLVRLGLFHAVYAREGFFLIGCVDAPGAFRPECGLGFEMRGLLFQAVGGGSDLGQFDLGPGHDAFILADIAGGKGLLVFELIGQGFDLGMNIDR